MSEAITNYDQKPARDNALYLGAISKEQLERKLVLVLGLLLIIRLFLLFWLPFTDTTEARYAEIARKMIETNNWITPQFDYGVPFWGKPPLHTWLSAIGMKLFGVGPFGARVLILVTSFGVLAVLYSWARMEAGRTIAIVATVVCTSSVLFFGASAFVMTDMSMVLGTTLCMVGFFIASSTRQGDRVWGHLFFVGLAIGLLAKGPTAVVVTGIPIFLWLLLGNRWHLVGHLPWITGVAVTVALTAPWYALAEISTPGFLRYFLVGEHIERFLVPGWQGDLYGAGHEEPKGMIWLFALGAFLPWTLLLLSKVAQPKKSLDAFSGLARDRVLYLVLWTIAPMILFTPAANVLPAYVLPAVPAFALLVATVVVSDFGAGSKFAWSGFWVCIAVAIVFFATVTSLVKLSPETLEARTKDSLVSDVLSVAPDAAISTFPHRSFSAEFYTRGTASALPTEEDLRSLGNNRVTDAVIVHNSHLDTAKQSLGIHFSELRTYRRHTIFLEVSE
ncbi:MAG: glycosyltransferase family 39 protein [Pseudomonadota bacterium]